MSNEEMLTEPAARFREFLSTDNGMDAPIDPGEKVVILIARFGFGFGAGGSQGKDGGGVEPVPLEEGISPAILGTLS
jgi:uncharacterized spore protein YtfJ